jgi:hypothetical protein
VASDQSYVYFEAGGEPRHNGFINMLFSAYGQDGVKEACAHTLVDCSAEKDFLRPDVTETIDFRALGPTSQ